MKTKNKSSTYQFHTWKPTLCAMYCWKHELQTQNLTYIGTKKKWGHQVTRVTVDWPCMFCGSYLRLQLLVANGKVAQLAMQFVDSQSAWTWTWSTGVVLVFRSKATEPSSASLWTWPDRNWRQHLRPKEASLATWKELQRWYTSLTRTLTLRTTNMHGRQGQLRHEAGQGQDRGHHQGGKVIVAAKIFSHLAL